MRIIIAGGGTGGHLFPGIAIAQELMGRSRANDVLFVGTERGLEAKVLPKLGYPLRTIEVSGLKRVGAGAFARGLVALPRALAESLAIVRKYDPDLVVGVGGYSSGPMVLGAALLGLPTAILEQNSIPGITNRILGRIARRAFISFDRSRRYFPEHKTCHFGNPIRAELHALERTGRDLLIVGGSQGAHALNELAIEAVGELVRRDAPLPPIFHQTGQADAESVEARYRALGLAPSQVRVAPFIDDMKAAYASAGLALCRAGATTIAELTAIGLPAIFIPFPHAADNHQYFNAKALEEAGGARVLEEGKVTGGELAALLAELTREPERLATMSERMRRLGKPEAARTIVDALEELTFVPRA